jgi:hypothetical protein
MTDTRSLCSQCKTRPVKPRYKRCARCRGAEFDTCACGAQKTKRARSCQPCARKRRGPEHACWKGGVIQNSDGYLLQWSPDHPRARGQIYIKQHHLIMEEALGRYLLPGETVHHKNGVRNDNRLSNLELWITFQPSGQRPEDLVEWAQEILRRYA